MTKVEIDLCPVCERVLKKRHGLAVSITYSEGGWGHARALLRIGAFHRVRYDSRPIIYSEEICEECFDEIIPHLKAASEVYKKRRGINRPKVVDV